MFQRSCTAATLLAHHKKGNKGGEAFATNMGATCHENGAKYTLFQSSGAFLPKIAVSRSDESSAFCLYLLATDATFNMIIDQPHSLHEGIDCGSADKRPAALFEILGNGF